MNIFVGNLAFSATDHDLRQLFEQYGAVDTVNIIWIATRASPAALALWRCQTALRPKRPLRDSKGLPWPGGPSMSMRPSRVNRVVSRVMSSAAPAGKPAKTVELHKLR